MSKINGKVKDIIRMYIYVYPFYYEWHGNIWFREGNIDDIFTEDIVSQWHTGLISYLHVVGSRPEFFTVLKKLIMVIARSLKALIGALSIYACCNSRIGIPKT